MKISPVTFGATFEVDGGKTKNKAQIADYYNQRINTLKNKKMVATQVYQYMNSPEIKAKIKQLPDEDYVLLSTHLNPECDNEDEFNNSVEIIYYSDNHDTNEKLGYNFKTGAGNLDELRKNVECDFNCKNSNQVDTNKVDSWLENIIRLLNKTT